MAGTASVALTVPMSLRNGTSLLALLAALAAPASAPAATDKDEGIPCPAPRVDPPPEPGAEESWNAEKLEGRKIKKAKKVAERHGCTVRVVKRNGEDLPVTMDFSYNRINVSVRDRRVKKVFTVS